MIGGFSGKTCVARKSLSVSDVAARQALCGVNIYILKPNIL